MRSGVISDATKSALMKRRGLDARPHVFRSSFRIWCAEAAGVPENVAKTVLAHVYSANGSRACNRSDLLEKRHPVMARWADHAA